MSDEQVSEAVLEILNSEQIPAVENDDELLLQMRYIINAITPYLTQDQKEHLIPSLRSSISSKPDSNQHLMQIEESKVEDATGQQPQEYYQLTLAEALRSVVETEQIQEQDLSRLSEQELDRIVKNISNDPRMRKWASKKNMGDFELSYQIKKSLKQKFNRVAKIALFRAGLKTGITIGRNLIRFGGDGVAGFDKIMAAAQAAGRAGALDQGIIALQSNLLSCSTWAIAAAIAICQVGCLAYDYFKGRISGKMFLKMAAIKIVTNVSASVSAAVGASIGAALGSLICPGLGTIIVSLIGGCVAGYFGGKLAEEAMKKKLLTEVTVIDGDLHLQIDSPNDLYIRMLQKIGLQDGCTFANLESQKRHLAFIYHPDKAGQQEKFIEMMEAYQIVKTYKQHRKDKA